MDGSRAATRTPELPLLSVVAVVLGGVAVSVAVATGRAGTLLAGLVALALVMACVQRLDVGLAVLVALSFTYAFDVGEKDLGIQSLRIPFVAFLLVACIFSRRPGWSTPAVGIPRALIAIGAYGAFVLASTFWASDPRPVVAGAVSLGKILLVVVTVIALITDDRSLRLAVWSLLVAAGVLAAISLQQHVTGNFDMNYLGFAKAPVRNIVGETEAPRVAGPTGDPNAFAQMMVVAVPLALERLVHERRRRLRLAAGAVAVLCAVTTVLTFSRGGFLALVVVLTLFLVRLRPPMRHVLLGGALLLVIASVVPSTYVERVARVREVLPGFDGSNVSPSDGALRGRTTVMKIALAMWSDHPVIGVGYGNYVVRFAEYNRRHGLSPQLGEAPHNLYLEIASETGLIGLGLWLAVVVTAFRSLAFLRRRSRAPDGSATENLPEGLSLALVAFLVTSMFLHGSYPMAFWLLVAISFAAGQLESRPESTEGAAVPAPEPAPVAGG